VLSSEVAVRDDRLSEINKRMEMLKSEVSLTKLTNDELKRHTELKETHLQ
jgi:hypothetical protein